MFLAVIFLFSACGEDNIVNNIQNTTEKVFLQKDSFGITTNDSGWIYNQKLGEYSLDSLYRSGYNQMYVEFDGFTNIVDTNSSFNLYVRAGVNQTSYWSQTIQTYEQINKHYKFQINVPAFARFSYHAWIYNVWQGGTKHLYFKNLKIYIIE